VYVSIPELAHVLAFLSREQCQFHAQGWRDVLNIEFQALLIRAILNYQNVSISNWEKHADDPIAILWI